MDPAVTLNHSTRSGILNFKRFTPDCGNIDTQDLNDTLAALAK